MIRWDKLWRYWRVGGMIIVELSKVLLEVPPKNVLLIGAWVSY